MTPKKEMIHLRHNNIMQYSTHGIVMMNPMEGLYKLAPMTLKPGEREHVFKIHTTTISNILYSG